jgi:hypothetical protein
MLAQNGNTHLTLADNLALALFFETPTGKAHCHLRMSVYAIEEKINEG